MTRISPKACLLLSALIASPASAMTEAEFQELAAEIFQPVIAEHDIPGLVLGVTMGGDHYLYVFGEADRENATPVTGDTIFELGSVSKLFNVTLAALAAERGLIDLDRPVSDYLPELAGSAFDQVTLMDLATHTTGGLPLQVPEELRDTEQLLGWLAEWHPIDAPGPTRSYSNVSIGLLGHITAAAMETSYTEAAEGTLFPLLDLESTYIDVPAEAEARYAFGYSREDDRPIRVNRGLLDAEAYGVKSSASDMLRFLDVSLGSVEAPPDVRSAIEQTQVGRTATEFYLQAMIWEQYPWPVDLDRLLQGNGPGMSLEPQPVTRLEAPRAPATASLLNKTGSTNGFGAYVSMLPSEDLGVVVLANRNYPNLARVEATYELIRRLLEVQDG